MTLRRFFLAAAVSAAVLFALAPPAVAVWPVNPATNLPVCTATGRQYSPVEIAPDGSGGAFVTWTDGRAGNYDIYAQHVLGAGYADPLWPVNGLGVLTLANNQRNPIAVSDGAGGVLLMWEDDRSGSGLAPHYATRVRGGGTLDAGWGTNGRLLSAYNAYQNSAQCASDGAGGLLATWTETRGATGYDVYVQRVNAAGTVSWGTNALLACGATGEQYEPTVCSDLAGGAIVAWYDYRKAAGYDYDIYATRVLANGTLDPRWTANGVAICTLTGSQAYVRLLTDGAGGAFLVWADGRSAAAGFYAHHVRGDGTLDPAWPANGRFVHGTIYNYVPMLESDGAGGIVMLTSDGVLVVNRVLASGVVDPSWPVGGVHLPSELIAYPAVVSDGAGGLLVVAEDYRPYNGGGYPALTAWRVRSTGVFDPAWSAEGVTVSSVAPSLKSTPRATTDGAGGAIVAWTDGRNFAATDYDEYAQRVRSNGTLGAPAPLITGAQDVRGDQGGRLLLTWMASEGDAAPNGYVGNYHVWRRIQADVAATRAAPVAARAPGEGPRAGDVREQPGVTGSTWWEFLATVPASRMPYYALLVSTTADSLPGWVPWNVFVVDAEDNTAWAFYSSPADSGYSADNLAPPLTAPAFGQYTQGIAHLSWPVSPAPDFKEFRLYRSPVMDFWPGPENFVVALRDTEYVDFPGEPSVYILQAVDVHGNPSPNGLIVPDGVLDAGGPAPPKALAFRGAHPNPARGHATFAVDLPSAASVRVRVFDVAGRCVRELEANLPAGSHRLAWDARDGTGGAAAPGLYLARFEAPGYTKVARFVLTR